MCFYLPRKKEPCLAAAPKAGGLAASISSELRLLPAFLLGPLAPGCSSMFWRELPGSMKPRIPSTKVPWREAPRGGGEAKPSAEALGCLPKPPDSLQVHQLL